MASSGYVERDGHVIWEVSKVAVLQSHDFAGEAIEKYRPGTRAESMFIYLTEDEVLRRGEQEARWDAVARSPRVYLVNSVYIVAVTSHAPRQALQAWIYGRCWMSR